MPVSIVSFVPKYQIIYDDLLRMVDKMTPGERLPSILQLKADYNVSQSTIERSLDEMERKGLVRRRRGSGVYVEGWNSNDNVICVFSDIEISDPTNYLFLKGVRKVAEQKGFQVADFGPRNFFRIRKDILPTLTGQKFSGIITRHSGLDTFLLDNDRHWMDRLNAVRLPLVMCRPTPAVQVDSVTPDYFASFQQVGEYLRKQTEGPIYFIGNTTVPCFARLQGLEVGLGGKDRLVAEITYGNNQDFLAKLNQFKKRKINGHLIIGVPMEDYGFYDVFQGTNWGRDPGMELVMLLHDHQSIPDGVTAHVVVKPSFRMGEVAARLMIRRIHGYRAEVTHETVKHEVRLNSTQKANRESILVHAEA